MSTTRPIDRVALESVIFQAFSLSVRKPLAPTFLVDGRLISRAQDILTPASSPSSSPVLSIPLSLYNLIREIVCLCTNSMHREKHITSRIAADLEQWENYAMQQQVTLERSSEDYYHACFQSLYAIAASILYNWVMGRMALPRTTEFSSSATHPGTDYFITDAPSWHVKRALVILTQPGFSDIWTRSYLAAWPMLIFGLATQSQEEAKCIRDTIICIREQTSHRLATGILTELEDEWRAKWQCDILFP